MKIKFLLALSLILFIPLNAYSKILQLNNCALFEPAERDMMRDRIVKIDLKNKKLTFRGYAAYTDKFQTKDELQVYQHNVEFTVLDSKLVQFKITPKKPKVNHEYTADFDTNIFQIKTYFNFPDGTTKTRLSKFKCENNNFEDFVKSGKKDSGSKSKSLLKKLLKKN